VESRGGGVTRLLAHVPNARVRYDAAGDHGHADLVREARRAAQREVRSPMPHWDGVRQHEQEQCVALLDRLKRLRRPNTAQQHQIEQLRSELSGTSHANGEDK